MAEPGDLVVMTRPTLKGVREPRLPAGYGLRPFRPGDEDGWVAIHEAADRYNPASLDLFCSEFGRSTPPLAERQLYAVDPGGAAVGTVTAWYPEPEVASDAGRIHWLAVVPGHQRQGVGAGLLAAALRRLAELGYGRAYLTTSSMRAPAIGLYKAFGFRLGEPMDVEDR